jgi:hypothetical protein
LLRPLAGLVEELGLRGGEWKIGPDNKMLDRRKVQLVLISVLAAFCGGLAWALDHEVFAVAFAAAAVTGAFGAVTALVGTSGS